MLGKLLNFFRKEKFNYEYEVYYLLLKDKTLKNGYFTTKKVGFQTQNTLAQVEFDYKIVYKYEDDPNEEIVGFFHTHPRGCDYMSITDVNTMNAWTKCLGRRLLCEIDSGVISRWWCYPDGKIVKIKPKANDYDDSAFWFAIAGAS